MKTLKHAASSNLHSSTYDESTQTLHMTFKRDDGAGDTYKYEGVPPHLYDGLANADSAGKYFHANIKSSYKGTKV